MSTTPPPEGVQEPDAPETRDAESWAKPVSELHLSEVPADAVNLNVEGKRLAGLTGGFGKLWQKTYRVSLDGAAVLPAEVISAWKADFPSFWPEGNRFYGRLTGISPGDVALLNLAMPGRVKMSTGIYVIYADDESFSFMNPEGHMFHGMITFSAADEGGVTVVQAQALVRAQDPIYELAMAFGGHRKEDRFWVDTLTNLAGRFGVEGDVETRRVCVDGRRQWSNWRNVRHNAALRSGLYMVGAPFRLMARPLRRRRDEGVSGGTGG